MNLAQYRTSPKPSGGLVEPSQHVSWPLARRLGRVALIALLMVCRGCYEQRPKLVSSRKTGESW